MNKRWTPFLIISILYIIVSLSVSFDRYVNLDEQVFEAYGRTDYLLHAVLGGVVSTGVSPYSNWLHTYVDHIGIEHKIIPSLYSQYVGGTCFNAILIRLTNASPDFVAYSLSPALINIILVIAIYIACHKLELNPIQSFFFFIAFVLLNDQMLYRTIYGSAEQLSTAIGIIGLAFFIKEDYYRAILPLSISSVMHSVGIGRFAILGTYVFLSTIHTFIKNNFSLHKTFKLKDPQSPHIAQIFSLTVVAIVIGAYLYPMTIQSDYFFTESENITIQNNIIITVDIVKNFTKPPPLYLISNGSKNLDLSWYYYPKNIRQLISVFSYPFSYIYWNTMSRCTLNSTLSLFGYNLTLAEVESLHQFNLKTPIQVIAIPIIYSFGYPLLFLLAIRECIKTRDNRKILLTISAYLLIIFFAISFYLFGTALFPQRFIRITGEFFIFVLLGSDVFSPNTKPKRTAMLILSIFLFVRFIVYFAGVYVTRGF